MSIRRTRAERRAARLRNQRILIGLVLVLILAAIGFAVFNAVTGSPPPDATPTPAAAFYILEDLYAVARDIPLLLPV